MIDIFIKTYPGDFIWLDFCLKSIKKFTTGFRKVVIVTDSGTNLDVSNHDLPIEIFYEDLPNESHPCPVGIGYVWAQNTKLNWTKYTDADFIVQIDSDTMFISNFNIQSLFREDGITWFCRDWSESGEGEVHRVPADFFIKRETIQDHMPVPIWAFSRKTTLLFQDWVNENWGGTWNYLNNHARQLWTMELNFESKYIDTHKSWGSCEYHMYGNFLEFYHPDEYKFVHINNYNVPIRQSWSWGGLKEEEIKLRNSILE